MKRAFTYLMNSTYSGVVFKTVTVILSPINIVAEQLEKRIILEKRSLVNAINGSFLRTND